MTMNADRKHELYDQLREADDHLGSPTTMDHRNLGMLGYQYRGDALRLLVHGHIPEAQVVATLANSVELARTNELKRG